MRFAVVRNSRFILMADNVYIVWSNGIYELKYNINSKMYILSSDRVYIPVKNDIIFSMLLSLLEDFGASASILENVKALKPE